MEKEDDYQYSNWDFTYSNEHETITATEQLYSQISLKDKFLNFALHISIKNASYGTF